MNCCFFVINFDSQLVDVAINIPSHAFDFLQIPQMESYQAVDLMTGAKEEICLLPYKPTENCSGSLQRKNSKKSRIRLYTLIYAHHSNKYSKRLF